MANADAINFVLDQEAEESDEGFNVFDQQANKLSVQQSEQLVAGSFASKFESVRKSIDLFPKREKISYFMEKDITQKLVQLKKSDPDAYQRLKFNQTENQGSNENFGFDRKVGQNFYDDLLDKNQPNDDLKHISEIQKEIAQMT